MKPDWFVELCVIKLSCLSWLQPASISRAFLANQKKRKKMGEQRQVAGKSPGWWKKGDIERERETERQSIRRKRKSLGGRRERCWIDGGWAGSQRGIDMVGTGESGDLHFIWMGWWAARRQGAGPRAELPWPCGGAAFNINTLPFQTHQFKGTRSSRACFSLCSVSLRLSAP